MGERKRVLVVGGTGYLGQHLLQALAVADEAYDVAFTHHRPYPPQELLRALGRRVLPFRVDVRNGDGLGAISANFGEPDVIVNCAALSSHPCEMDLTDASERDPTAAMATNVPTALVNWLSGFNNGNCLLIHLSTDQVYEGVKSFYEEEDETVPVNMYGKSKVAAEQFISAKCSNFAILRSSMIYGPPTISPVKRPLIIQWIDSFMSQFRVTGYLRDDFCCPVYVRDVVNIILALAKKWISDGRQMQLLLNVGGPDRLSRLQIAESVANIKGYGYRFLIKPVSASSVNWSPRDRSMNISRLIQVLGIMPTSFQDGLRSTLGVIGGP